jgi:hypothetical protein
MARAHAGGHGRGHLSRFSSGRRGGWPGRYWWGFTGYAGDTADPQLVSWIQSCLSQSIGSWVPQTGRLGRATRHAIRTFQSQQGLPVNGTPDSDTVALLQKACGNRTPSDSAPATSSADDPVDSTRGMASEVSTKLPAKSNPKNTQGGAITHTGPGRFTITFKRPTQESIALKQLFLDGKLPSGFKLKQDPNGKGTRWVLTIPSGLEAVFSNAKNFTRKLAEALEKAAMDNVLSLSPEESAAAAARIREHNERVGKIYVPFLDMTVKQAFANYSNGWFEKNGYFVWIGNTDPWSRSLQAVELSKTFETFNRDMRYYLGKGMSIKQAQRAFSDNWDENLRMLIVGMFGA